MSHCRFVFCDLATLKGFMDRRKFLYGTGLIGFLAFLQACRLGNILEEATPAAQQPTLMPPKPTKPSISTSTSAPLNTVSPTSTLAPTNTPNVPTATSTPTTEVITPNSPLATPTSTPTPTPTPTPYPSGPPSKLGLFVTRFDPAVLDITAEGQPALIKTLEFDGNFVQGLKDSSPTSLIVAQMPLDSHNLDVDQGPLVQAFVDQLLPLATDPKRMAAIDAWEAYNEPIADTPDRMKRLAEFEAERTRILADNGIRSVIGNFSTGNPPLELWPDFQAALESARQYGGFLGLHEYAAPTMQHLTEGNEGWLTLRYRKVYRQFLEPMGFGDLPLLITECGVDGLVQPRPGPAEAQGWIDFIPMWLDELGFRDDPPGVYMDQLLWYDQNLQQDAFVKGAAIFLVGANTENWRTYDLLDPRAGRIADLLKQYLSVHLPDGVTR